MSAKNSDIYQKLQSLPREFSLPEPEQISDYQIPAGKTLSYCWAMAGLPLESLSVFQEFNKTLPLLENYRRLFAGEKVNLGENRAVSHHLLRARPEDLHTEEARKIHTEHVRERERAIALARELRGKFSSLIHIGIGGSGLGPQLVTDALDYLHPSMRFELISNIDPAETQRTLRRVKKNDALILVVSKSGSTQETLENLAALKARHKEQVIAITTKGSKLDRPDEFRAVLYMDVSIGGRYSVTSVIGSFILALLYSPQVMHEFLEGAREADQLAFRSEVRDNAALLDALIGIYQRNILQRKNTAIIPYASPLRRLAAYLQQLDMESNGKSSTRERLSSSLATAPVVFGEPGTDAQHSFFQLLHQGTDIIPVQFIGFHHPQIADPGDRRHSLLNANLAAQIVALAKGHPNKDINRHFPGMRPSTLLSGDTLNPGVLGSIIAHFENKIMFQGFAWNINSFDQEGVQLGKRLVSDLLEHRASPLLQSYAKLLKIRIQ